MSHEQLAEHSQALRRRFAVPGGRLLRIYRQKARSCAQILSIHTYGILGLSLPKLHERREAVRRMTGRSGHPVLWVVRKMNFNFLITLSGCRQACLLAHEQ